VICRPRAGPPWPPFFVGTGTASDLLYRAGSSGSFGLAGSASLGSGIVILTYQSTAR